MIRQTIIPTSTAYTLTIPNEWIGKNVTIVYDKEWEEATDTPLSDGNKPSNIFAECRIDLSSFTFNRDEANNYD